MNTVKEEPKKVILQVGDCFKQAWEGCREPMIFQVLDIDRDKNSLRVKCMQPGGYNHEEEWDDLNVTEAAFSIGEYKIICTAHPKEDEEDPWDKDWKQ